MICVIRDLFQVVYHLVHQQPWISVTDEADRVLKGRDIGADADGHGEVFGGVLSLGIRRLGLEKICVFKKNFKVERGSIRKD